MVQQITHRLGILKTTALGGLVFLLPLIVIAALLGKLVEIVWVVARALGDFLPNVTPNVWALLVALAIVLVLAACFLAGLAAEWTFSKRISTWLEKNLLLLFPRYSIIKAQLAGTLGDERTKQSLKPVLVKLDDAQRLAFEVDRAPGGLVAVYLPGSPDPWSGTIAYFEPNRVQPASVDLPTALDSFENLGANSARLLAGQPSSQSTATERHPR